MDAEGLVNDHMILMVCLLRLKVMQLELYFIKYCLFCSDLCREYFHR